MYLCHIKSKIKHKLVFLSFLIQEVGTYGYHRPSTPEIFTEQTLISYREKFAIHVLRGGYFVRTCKSQLEQSASTLCAQMY